MATINPFALPAKLSRLQIEITTGCNLHCTGCQRTLGMAAHTWHNGHMPEARFAAILANAPPADTIILQGIGEPTLHPDLRHFVALARVAGIGGFPDRCDIDGMRCGLTRCRTAETVSRYVCGATRTPTFHV